MIQIHIIEGNEWNINWKNIKILIITTDSYGWKVKDFEVTNRFDNFENIYEL